MKVSLPSLRTLGLTSVAALALVACTADSGAPEDATGEAAVAAGGELAEWARAESRPIDSLSLADDGRMAAALAGAVDGDVVLVGVGESAHGTHEFNQLRAKVFQYLAEVHGFSVIIPETGFIEARLVDDYVQGKSSLSLSEVLEKGMTHGMGPWQETRDLVEWMRKRNAMRPPEQRVHFAGKDLSVLGDTLTVPLEPLAAYLAKVDPSYATSADFTRTLALAQQASAVTLRVEAAYRAKGAHAIEPDYLDAFTTISFEQLSANEQANLEGGVWSVVARFQKHASDYARRSSDDDAVWYSQVAVYATQLVRNLRARQTHPKITGYDSAVALLAKAAPDVKVDTRPASDLLSHQVDMTSGEQLHDYMLGRNARELALADNVQWVQRRFGKAMNFAHNGHLFKQPLPVAQVGDVSVKAGMNEGAYLFHAYGARYTLFGGTNIDFADAEGKPSDSFFGAPVATAAQSPNTLEHDLASVLRPGQLGMFLDFKHGLASAAPSVRDRLTERQIRWQVGFQSVPIQGNLDGIFVFRSAGPGRPL